MTARTRAREWPSPWCTKQLVEVVYFNKPAATVGHRTMRVAQEATQLGPEKDKYFIYRAPPETDKTHTTHGQPRAAGSITPPQLLTHHGSWPRQTRAFGTMASVCPECSRKATED